MTATDPQALADAEAGGRRAARDDRPLGANPFSQAQGSPTRALAIAWRRGWRQERDRLDVDQAEAAGHFRTAR